MGVMSETAKATYEGNQIDVEARVTNVMGTGQYSLFINNERVDETEATHGEFTLRGKLPEPAGGAAKQVTVRIDQGLVSTDYVLDVDGETYEMTKS